MIRPWWTESELNVLRSYEKLNISPWQVATIILWFNDLICKIGIKLPVSNYFKTLLFKRLIRITFPFSVPNTAFYPNDFIEQYLDSDVKEAIDLLAGLSTVTVWISPVAVINVKNIDF